MGGSPWAARAGAGLVARVLVELAKRSMRSAADGVQLHGGSGFMRDLLAEKRMRDAKRILPSPKAF